MRVVHTFLAEALHQRIKLTDIFLEHINTYGGIFNTCHRFRIARHIGEQSQPRGTELPNFIAIAAKELGSGITVLALQRSQFLSEFRLAITANFHQQNGCRIALDKITVACIFLALSCTF